jgi:four helix bundle protein
MMNDLDLMERVYELVQRVYEMTIKDFPETERPLLGLQLRETTLGIASNTTGACSTDDPAEQQITLREAANLCIRFGILIRLARDMKHVTPSEHNDLSDRASQIDERIAFHRRTYRPVRKKD